MRGLAWAGAVLATAALNAAPVGFDWKTPETMPVKVARPFAGFLPDGRFVVAGGSDFVDGRKVYRADIALRSAEGEWMRCGELSAPLAEGVSCETPAGVFCAGGTDGASVSSAAFLVGETLAATALPDLPEPVAMGAAACDGEAIYVVAERNIYRLAPGAARWLKVAELPSARAQHVAAVQNGDQKEKVLVVYGGYDPASKAPLADGFALRLSAIDPKGEVLAELAPLAPLPGKTTTIGAAFLASGNQHILLIGGFGWDGWIARAMNGSTEEDPVKLGWQRKIFAYNAVTGAWCEYGELSAEDAPRCGAAAALRPGKTPGQYAILLAGGETRPKVRTDRVTVAAFRKEAKFGAKAWIVVGVYALLMIGMAAYFILKPKDENDYFRGGNKIPWYVAGMSIFATMLSSITFIAIPTQAYLSDWRYFPMAICILAIAPVAIFYYLPFFCRLGITSAYEYLEKRFNLGVRLFGSAAFVVFMVCRVAVVTLLPAIALNAVTGISIDACILICGVLTMVYCSLGGLEAVIWSDFIQGIVLLGGALAVLIILILRTGPEGAHMASFVDVATTHGKTTMWDFRWILSQPVLWVVLVQGVVSNLASYTSDQCVIQRYIATPDENATKRSIWFNGVMSIFASVIFYGIGTALFTHYRTNPALMDVTMPKSDSVFPTFMAAELPWWLAGLVIAAIFAATISTLSANLSSASTAVVSDFIKRFRPNIGGRAQIRCGQACTYAVGVVGILAALGLARLESRALFDNFQEFIAMLTAGLTGLFFMGVFMPRVKGLAAVVGLVANYAVCFGLKAAGCTLFGWTFHPFLLGGMGLAVCVLTAWLCSFVLRETGKDLRNLTLRTLKD
ncbi:MAG: sodium/solute symporter [Kiritimatiellia bacterium]